MNKVTLAKQKVKIIGDEINIGDSCAKVVLVDAKLQENSIGGSRDKIQLILTVPSLDTKVCAKESNEFNKKIKDLNIDAFVVSMDLPFASDRFCRNNDIDNITMLSDFREKEFALKYGVYIDDGVLKGLHTRAVFVIGKDGKLVYKEMVSEITHEPDYDKVMGSIKEIV
jgi:thiol peroxidase